MKKYQSMSGGHLGKISVAKHCINFIPSDASSVHAAPYLAGSRQRNLEKNEFQQIIKVDVAEPATTERTSPIVIVSKKDERLMVLHRLLPPQCCRRSIQLSNSEDR